MDAILKLHEQIGSAPLGVNREKAAPRGRGRGAGSQAHRADEGPAPVSEHRPTARPTRTSPARPPTGSRDRRGPARHVRRARHRRHQSGYGRPGPPGRSCPAPARGRTAATSTTLADRLERAGRRRTATAVEKVVVDRGEITFHVRREAPRRRHARRCATTRRCGSRCAWASPACTTRTRPAASCTPSTRCCRSPTTGGSASRSPAPTPTRTSRRSCSVYPGNDWHERETFDFFGIVFDGHPGLTRIEMPDDWPGHPQRKDYPLGGIPVEYKGAQIPPPDERRTLLVTGPEHQRRLHRRRRRRRRETTEGTVYTVTGQDWDTLTAGLGERRRGAHRRQHGSAAPVDPRRAPADPRARGRDGHRVPARHRLPAHRHREELRVPHLDPGRHVRDADGLPRAAVQRVRLRRAASSGCSASRTRSPSGPTSSA